MRRSSWCRRDWLGRWCVTAAAGLLVPVAVVVAPPASYAASVASALSALPTCPTMPYGFSEVRDSYGTSANGEPLDVDVYRPATSATGNQPPATVPGVILVHGGEWSMGELRGRRGNHGHLGRRAFLARNVFCRERF